MQIKINTPHFGVENIREIMNLVPLPQYVLVGLYTPSLLPVFKRLSSQDRKKIPIIVDLNYGGNKEIFEDKKIIKYPLPPNRYSPSPRKGYSPREKLNSEEKNLFTGSVGIISLEGRTNKDLTSILKKFSNFSAIVIFSPSKLFIPPIERPPKEWTKREFYTIRNYTYEIFSRDEDETIALKNFEKVFNPPSPMKIAIPGRITPFSPEDSPSSPSPLNKKKALFSEEYGLDKFVSSLEKYPSPYPRGNSIPFTDEWYETLRKYLSSILDIFFDRNVFDDIETSLFSDEMLRSVFKRTFTSPVYDFDPENNYDQYESIGDAALKFCFKNFVLENQPLVEDRELNELTARYMSSEFQPALGKKMNLQDWVVVDELTRSIPNKIIEDVLEALCGAFCEGCKRITSSSGKGIDLIQSLINKVWGESGLDITLTFGSNKTIIEQLETRYGLEKDSGKPKEFTLEDGNKRVEYLLQGPNLQKWMSDILSISGKEIPPLPKRIYSSKVGKSKKSAEAAATDDIILQFEKLGITREMMTYKDIRLTQMYRNERYTSLIDNVIAKIKRENPSIIRVYTETPKENNVVDTKVVYLVGVEESGKLIKIFGEAFTPKGKGKEDEEKMMNDYLTYHS